MLQNNTQLPPQPTQAKSHTRATPHFVPIVAHVATLGSNRARSALVQQMLSGLLIALMLLLTTGNVAQAAFTSTTATVNNQTSYTAFPGEFIAVKVTVSRDGGTNWRRTSYRYGAGAATCLNTPNHDGTGTNTETVFIPAPGSAGASTLNIWAHSNTDNCNDEPPAAGKTSLTVTVNEGYPTTANNPDLIPNCGLNVILVLDESYSIQTSGAVGTVRSAANAFLSGFNNTGTSVAIVEFNTLARIVFNYTLVSGANLTAMQNYVNDVNNPPQGGYNPAEDVAYTNWDDALNKVAELNTGVVAPLVVFITDGDPTTYGPGTDIETSDAGAAYPANDPRMTHAVAGANIVKQQGSHILAVGVGEGLQSAFSQQRLKDITGNDVYPNTPLDLKTTDVILVANFDNLQTALQDVITDLCAPSLTITKMVDPDTGVYAPASGWQFSASARFPEGSNGTNFNWTQPQVAPGTDVVAGTIGGNGTLTFQWDLLNQTGNSKITVTETVQSGYTFQSATCQLNSGSGTPQTSVSGNSFTVTGIANDAVVTCEVKNKYDAPPTIVVDKVANPTSIPETGGNVQFTFSVQNTSVEPVTITALSDDKFGTLTGDDDCKVGTVLAPNASCTFAQTFPVPAGNAPGSHVNVFTAKAIDNEQNEATDTDDAAVTYTDAPPTVVVNKVANPTSIPETGGNVQFTFTVTNTSAEPVTITALSDDKFAPLPGGLAGDDDCKVGTVLAPNASCTFAQTFPVPGGTIGGSHVNVFTATVVDDEQNPAGDTDDATVTYTDAPPTVVVNKVANPTSIPETGGNVQFTFSVQNTSGEAVTITALSDDKFGTLTGDDDCKVGTVLAPNASCTFAQTFPVPAGNAPGSHVNVFTATVVDNEQNTATDTDDATVTYTDAPPTVLVNKVAGVFEIPESGGDVQFTFTVTNTSAEPVTITALSDDKYGTLAGDADCKVGTVLAAGASCTFAQSFNVPAGTIGGSHVNTFTATVVDDDEEQNTATDTENETVEYVEEPTDPTSLPVTDQPSVPQQQERIFLPALGN